MFMKKTEKTKIHQINSNFEGSNDIDYFCLRIKQVKQKNWLIKSIFRVCD